jgi:hypothetical protein
MSAHQTLIDPLIEVKQNGSPTPGKPFCIEFVERIQAARVLSAAARVVISLLPGLFIDLAPDGERQRLPLLLRQDVPELRLANLLEVFIDFVAQVSFCAGVLGCHDFPLLLVLRLTIFV